MQKGLIKTSCIHIARIKKYCFRPTRVINFFFTCQLRNKSITFQSQLCFWQGSCILGTALTHFLRFSNFLVLSCSAISKKKSKKVLFSRCKNHTTNQLKIFMFQLCKKQQFKIKGKLIILTTVPGQMFVKNIIPFWQPETLIVLILYFLGSLVPRGEGLIWHPTLSHIQIRVQQS